MASKEKKKWNSLKEEMELHNNIVRTKKGEDIIDGKEKNEQTRDMKITQTK